MSTVSRDFSYSGQFKPGTGGAYLQANGISTDVGHTMPRDYYVARFAASWRAGSLTTGDIVLTVQIDDVDTALEMSVAQTDVAGGYKVAAAASLITIEQNSHLQVHAVGADADVYLTDLLLSVELDTVTDLATSDDVLANIVVTTSDLKAVRPDIEQYLFPGESDFAKAILQCKKELYAEIKLQERARNLSYTNAELDTYLADIKDLPKEECLKQRLKYMVVATAFRDSRLFNEAEVYDSKAKAMPLQYFIDADDDDAAGDDEVENNFQVRLGR